MPNDLDPPKDQANPRSTVCSSRASAEWIIDLPIELALIRWSVVHQRWSDFSSGNMPCVKAFLAGWFCRTIEADEPLDKGQYRDSFRAGWVEASEQIVINNRRLERLAKQDKKSN